MFTTSSCIFNISRDIHKDEHSTDSICCRIHTILLVCIGLCYICTVSVSPLSASPLSISVYVNDDSNFPLAHFLHSSLYSRFHRHDPCSMKYWMHFRQLNLLYNHIIRCDTVEFHRSYHQIGWCLWWENLILHASYLWKMILSNEAIKMYGWKNL